MKRVSLILLLMALLFLLTSLSQAQKAKWVVTGYMDWQYIWSQKQDPGTSIGTFDSYHFNPIFLFQMQDNLLAAAEVEIEHGAEIELEYAFISYIWNDYVTLTGGKFLVPFGVFNERIHPTWIAKVPTRPFSNDQVIPVAWSEAGVMLSGAAGIAAPYSRVNYNLYLVNGLEGDAGDPMRDLRKEDVRDKENNNKAVGGRLGIVPYKGVEIGFSGYTGKYDAEVSPKLDLNLFGIDAEFHHQDFFELRGEFNQVDQAILPDTFIVKRGWYAQAALKLGFTEVDILNPVEIAVRYSAQDFGGKAADFSEITPCLNYYLASSTIFRIAYRLNQEKENEVDNNQFIVQFAQGF
ncbi:MAG: hypothetical protein A2142_05800 [candidate division Zixibacteria bacterium RBG_16_48_11]|nr:MAG: hypothetical protein A2142_05800 [candidate division Zixibacteria bacterium RBG_16_48_11]